MHLFRCALVVLVMLLAACAPAGSAVQITREPLISPTPAPTVTVPTLAPTLEVTNTAPLTLAIWWPEPLSPVDDLRVSTVLSEQTAAFEAQSAGVVVETRLKKPRDLGGIMETLRTASAVAPGALPDLTLLRREDLLEAVQMGLVQPLEGRVSSAIIGNLYTAALELGQVNGQLYGLPYVLDVQHIAYWGDFPSGDFATFDTVLERGRSYAFAASASTGISPVFLLQYLSAGGSLADLSVGEVNADALRAVLRFYEQAVSAGIIDPVVLNYTSANDYLVALQSRTIPAGVVSSTTYLQLGVNGQPLAFAPIPVPASQPTTILNGWMWVLTTTNTDRQAVASDFLNWMLDVTRQSQYSQAAHMLPSLRASLRQAGINAAYADFVTQLLGNAVLPLPEASGSATARVLQDALVAVLNGQRTAEEAAQDALNQLSG
ncbi:MAG: extracellular solute-binding protein [Chloroflexi bacterium]|nr:extracellular solute-binding protein [Chloroflexota bacterium]